MDNTKHLAKKIFDSFDEPSKQRFLQDLLQIAETKPSDPCWCKSGKLFAYCHRGRESERLMSDSLKHSEISRIMDNPKFCCATFDIQNCSGVIKGAHTIQRGRVLASMAPNNHVGTFNRNQYGFDKTISIQNGIKHQASIFYGFCDFHDVELFKNFEVNEFTATIENCWASSYRAICHEYYQKTAAQDAIRWLKDNQDKGCELYQQVIIQYNLTRHEIDLRKGLDSIRKIKVSFEEVRTISNYQGFTSHIIRLDAPLDIAVCATISPFHDLNGNKIQNLGDLNNDFQYFFISTVTTNENASYIISYLDDHEIIRSYLDQLFMRDHQFIFNWLTKSIFAHSENTYFRLSWWDNLETEQKHAIYDLAMKENYTQAFEYDDLVGSTISARISAITKL